MIKNSLKVLATLCLISCGNEFGTQQELLDYLRDEDNGYRYSKSVNDVEFVVQYKSTDLLVLQEMNSQSMGMDRVAEMREKYSKFMFFNLSISQNNKEILSEVANEEERFKQLANTLSFEIDEKIHLIAGQKDTLAMQDFVYPKLYGMAGATTVMVVFVREEKYSGAKYLNFIVEDLGLGTGDVKFKIRAPALNSEPKLRI